MESHIEVDDDLDIEESRQEIKRQLAQTDEKKKRKYFRKLFEFLGGGDSPIEALELALGRDKLLQVKQMNYMSIFSLWIDESNSDFVVRNCISCRIFQGLYF